MAKPVNLGRKLSDSIQIAAMNPDHEMYPDLCIETDDRRLAEMPSKGEATIKYRVEHRTHREEHDGKGKKDYSCTLHLKVLSIDPPEGASKPKDSDGGARKAMDDYFKDR